MSLFNLLPIFDVNFDFYILQIEMRDEEIKIAQSSRLFDYRKEFTSFNETAGLINYLDLVISVDTSVAHLSAALGKPTWLMLPFVPDFRWLLNRDYSPWYPTMRLFRQKSPGDWNGVVSEIQTELHKLFK
jgi:ADP-heptose:LPS heptosyltransferase